MDVVNDPLPTGEPTSRLPRGTVTFLLSDIEGSTESWGREPAAMRSAVERHYAIIDEVVDRHDGVRPQEQGEGDSTVAAFADAHQALHAALDIQLAIGRETWPGEVDLRVRIGLHTGEAQLRNEGNYTGLSIIRAARIRNLAHGGQVLVSNAVHDLVIGTLDAPMSLRSLGRHRLKGLGDVERIHQLEHPDLPADFPPSPAMESTPTNLPTRLTTFVGREREIADLGGLLDGHQLVTVTGAGGAGKTSVALQTASAQLDRRPDGVWWVELASCVDDDAVARSVADVVRTPTDGREPIVRSIARRLADDRALLVLDNTEHLIDAVADLVGVLLGRCPHLAILVTSRRVLGVPGEMSWRLPSLSLPPDDDTPDPISLERSDSITLFVERARAAAAPPLDLTGPDGPVVARICRRLDGIPLAIELAAARSRALAPRQILDGLTDALDLLTGGTRRSLTRHQTLDASISWSLDLMSDDERDLLVRLSVFIGSFDLDAVVAVCMDESPRSRTRALDLIDALIDHSLVTPVGGGDVRRLALLEVVRQYGARLLRTSGHEAATRRRHQRHFAGVAGRLGPSAETALEHDVVKRLDDDAGNLEAALVWCRDEGSPDQLAALVADLAPYWNMAAATLQSETWLTRALDATPAEPTPTRARLHAYRALGRSNRGDFPGSVEDCTAALDIATTVGDDWSIGRARWVIAEIATYGSLGTWRPLSDQAVETLTSSGDTFAEAYARVWQAVPYLIRGHLPDGIAALDDAVPAVARVDNPSINASMLAWQAWSAFHSGELRRAEEFATEALAGSGFRLATQRHFTESVAISAALHRGVESPLRDDFEHHTLLARRRGEELAAAVNELSTVGWLLLSDPVAARDDARRVLAAMPSAYKLGVCQVNLHAAWACVALDDVAGARRHVDDARAVGAVAEWPIYRADRLAVQSMIAIADGEPGRAASLADDAVALAETEGLGLRLVDALECRALAAAAADDLPRAAEILGATTAMRERTGYAEVFVPLSTRIARVGELAASALGDESFAAHRTHGARRPVRELIRPSEAGSGSGGRAPRR